MLRLLCYRQPWSTHRTAPLSVSAGPAETAADVSRKAAEAAEIGNAKTAEARARTVAARNVRTVEVRAARMVEASSAMTAALALKVEVAGPRFAPLSRALIRETPAKAADARGRRRLRTSRRRRSRCGQRRRHRPDPTRDRRTTAV